MLASNVYDSWPKILILNLIVQIRTFQIHLAKASVGDA